MNERPAPAEPATSNDIQPGPFSEHELGKAWNSQADQFNQWDSLDTCEQLAWAQTQAIAADRAGRPAPAEPADDTPSDRLALALCRAIANDLGGAAPACVMERGGPCPECRRQSAAVAHELAVILRERHGGSSQVADWLDGVGNA